MSKTERALTTDEVDASAELGGRDEAGVASGNGSGPDVDGVDASAELGGRDEAGVASGNGSGPDVDGETTAEIWAQVDEALDEYVAEENAEAVDVVDGDVDVEADGEIAEVVAGAVDVVDGDVDVEADGEIAEVVAGAVDVVDGDVEADGEAVVDEVDAADVTDDEVADDEVADLDDADRTAAHERADGDAAGAVDEDVVVEADGEIDVADGDVVDERYEIPEIIPATPEPGVAPAEGRDGDVETEEAEEAEEVSEDILEELRRADIDGPIVEMAPQDDTTSQRRRPKRAPDYDPAPVPIPADVPRVLGRKPRVRKVTRVVRHVDPWSVFKIAIVANLVLYVIVMTAGVLLWNVAHATGTVDNVERFFESFGWTSFEFNGGEIYHAAWIAGLFVVVGLTGLAVLLATLFNLITDLVGGVRLTVLEEEVVETRTSPMRRFVVRRAEPDVPVTLHDESGAMVREAVVDDSGAIKRPTR